LPSLNIPSKFIGPARSIERAEQSIGLVPVHPSHIAAQFTIQVVLDRLADFTAGEDHFQPGIDGFLVGGLPHAAANQHFTILDGLEHVRMSMACAMMLVMIMGVTGMMRFLTLTIINQLSIVYREDTVKRSHTKMATDSFSIFCYYCDLVCHFLS
jgi:hypothetical protein